ncbi:MAG: twin-arginine translocase TatA/TatE family subunit, partial [Myxococcales bacterium]|nr:twin-arginine translocase TatA/TatE family subunit [Myxococcales bacterium]
MIPPLSRARGVPRPRRRIRAEGPPLFAPFEPKMSRARRVEDRLTATALAAVGAAHLRKPSRRMVAAGCRGGSHPVRVVRGRVTACFLPRVRVVGSPKESVMLSPMEMGVVLLVAIMLFGPGRIAGVGKGLGQGIRNFK